MLKINPALLLDGYKTDHRRQYPEGTEVVYSNLTARGSRLEGVNSTIFFGLQYFIKEYLISQWNDNFFSQPKEVVCREYKEVLEGYCGLADYSHIEDLHDLGYLPIEIRAVEEGTEVPIRCPMMTIHNTLPEFFWVTNMLETVLSNVIWMPITAATIANQYRKLFNEYADKTGSDREFVPFQGHDFSYRGLVGSEAACLVGSGHLTSFAGTDTIPAIPFLKQYYGGTGLVGCSVPATEHSVMCLGGNADEVGTFKRLITETYPEGIVSIVSDTWDFWKVITEYLVTLKEDILARNGKLVIRPDSGDPVDIICGEIPFSSEIVNKFSGSYTKHTDKNGNNIEEFKLKGLIECLWDTFGGTINEAGYKVLDSHIGAIYGDSITVDRATRILDRLEKKGFAASNIVLGVGSFTYQYNTRDTFGMAVKATYGEVNGEPRNIFKDPKTDNGLKKSMKGLLKVNSDFSVDQEQNWEQIEESILTTVFRNGKLIKETNLHDIRARVQA